MNTSLALTAILADDEPFMRAALRERLQQLWPELQIVQECEDGLSALQAIQRLQPQLAFLDIRMPGLTGLQVAQSLQGALTRLVFVTAFDAHAIEAFEAQALDYVLKPVELPRLAKTVARLRQALAEQAAPQQLAQALKNLQQQPAPRPAAGDWLQVAVGSQVRLVHVDDVQFFESDSKYTRVVAEDCDGLIRLSLKELLERLDPQLFLQTHRSVVVNRRHVRGVHRRGEALELEIKGREERLKVSTQHHHLFKAM
ncbi:LytTR family transcriptional regulator DNA-binding domain-containing protein [Pelomonas sp. V22]|uniref:LytR/AlgR family response regulator transcription factor n=1 Tax=Pelomonas sp. V22 TaxID=2822139 RepID=UPI0024A84805|nr:response regulator [Pelomonas sp. V22]MDI4633869.1 LytTR family transcriptional regulator DNA-binding domain-containing protein [Pelomonas sp. V22]